MINPKNNTTLIHILTEPIVVFITIMYYYLCNMLCIYVYFILLSM